MVDEYQETVVLNYQHTGRYQIKHKHGTTKTFVKIRVVDNFTVLVCVTVTILPSSSVTDALIVAVHSGQVFKGTNHMF